MGKIRVMEMIDRPALGGGQRAVLLLAANLNPDLFDVCVSSAPGGPLVEEAEKSGLCHIPVPLDRKLGRSVIKKIASVLKNEHIDILHTHGGYAGLYGRWAAGRCGTPVVVHTLHGIHYLHYRNFLVRRISIGLERLLSHRTDRLILVSYADLGRAVRHGLAPPDSLIVIPNGSPMPGALSAEAKIRKRREVGWNPRLSVVGTVARLHRQKGVLYFILAAKSISARFPDARMAVVGDGPLGRALKRRARHLKIDDKVFFLGERRDANELMNLFDIFVLPSLWEGLPFVLVEAAALGKPIVATAVDGIPEVIEEEKTGLLVPPKDPQLLAEAVVRLLEDRELAGRLGERARASVPLRFPLRRMVEQTENLYLKLYKSKTSSIIKPNGEAESRPGP
jgi:glycosyltransferase involved in cell wall biosynthesis